MENLNQIREDLLASHKKIAKKLKLDECKSFTIDGINFYVSDVTLCARINYGDLEIEVNEYSEGNKRISIAGDISEALNALYKPMKQWKKITKYITEKNI